ncbi:hypothetical protein DQ04_02741040 [Trypanosoma grayi]|uniref:hypothetical protein n=1 Tax=Trypanosoma grayi TaxID=71804 RepID=UPI0004F4ABE0|nr:hypothetical protein DQ04_02741040 [Trypanosoma grayi]KEG11319.1 hypothetical protein DQ04_02741040 [Trypanosoma grayi]
MPRKGNSAGQTFSMPFEALICVEIRCRDGRCANAPCHRFVFSLQTPRFFFSFGFYLTSEIPMFVRRFGPAMHVYVESKRTVAEGKPPHHFGSTVVFVKTR